MRKSNHTTPRFNPTHQKLKLYYPTPHTPQSHTITHHPNKANIMSAFVYDITPGTQLHVRSGDTWHMVEVVTVHKTTHKYAVCNLQNKKGVVFKESDYGVEWVFQDESDSNSFTDDEIDSDTISENSSTYTNTTHADPYDAQIELMITSVQKTLEAIQLILQTRNRH